MSSPDQLSADGFDFVDPDVISSGMPLREFAILRQNAPVWWNARPYSPAFDDEGFWVVSRHEHIKAISKDSAAWSSAENGAVLTFPDGTTRDHVEATRGLLINQDPPDHSRLRKLASRMFTPRAVESMRETLRTKAADVVRQAAEDATGDFVTDIARKLPVMALYELIGVPPADHAKVLELADAMIGIDDLDNENDAQAASAELLGYAYAMAEERRRRPADDIVTTLVNADPENEWMTEAEFGFFVVVLAVAGNETTRNAISHGLNAFMDHRDQWDLFKAKRPQTTADEIVRWATPVYAFGRTARRDVQLGGAQIAAGDRVGLLYGSANFDESVFDRPERFDILRNPNPHLGFGGNGAHYCIGANLARIELDLMFTAIADAFPDISKVAEPVRMRSGLVNGIKRLDVRYA